MFNAYYINKLNVSLSLKWLPWDVSIVLDWKGQSLALLLFSGWPCACWSCSCVLMTHEFRFLGSGNFFLRLRLLFLLPSVRLLLNFPWVLSLCIPKMISSSSLFQTCSSFWALPGVKTCLQSCPSGQRLGIILSFLFYLSPPRPKSEEPPSPVGFLVLWALVKMSLGEPQVIFYSVIGLGHAPWHPGFPFSKPKTWYY